MHRRTIQQLQVSFSSHYQTRVILNPGSEWWCSFLNKSCNDHKITSKIHIFLGIDFKLAWMQRIITIVFLATNWVNHLSSVSRPELIRAIVDCGFEHPSEVQHECIPQAGPWDMTKKLDFPLTLWQVWKLIRNPTEHVILLVTGMTGMTGILGGG